MRYSIRNLFSATTLLLLLSSSVAQGDELSKKSLETSTVIKGVTYTKYKLENLDIQAHVLEINPAQAIIRPIKASNTCLGVEKASVIASQGGAIAAINGGFYDTHEPLEGRPSGILKIDGIWFSLPVKPRAALMWNEHEEKLIIDRITATAAMALNGTAIEISGMNTLRNDHEVVLYTPAFNSSKLMLKKGVQVEAIDGKISKVTGEETSITQIPLNGFHVSAGPLSGFSKPLQEAKDGDTLHYKISLTPLLSPDLAYLWNSDKAQHIVGGTPILIHNGKEIDSFFDEKVIESFVTHRHARTAVGHLKNGHWIFVVVEGRSDEPIKGMTMKELQGFMKELGCTDAMNLCGGKSSTMVVKGVPVNCEKTAEKPVSDIISIIPRN